MTPLMTTMEAPTLFDVDSLIRRSINTALTIAEKDLTSEQVARLRLALGNGMSDEADEIVDAAMQHVADALTDAVILIVDNIGNGPDV